ncbi:unnamed protein product [Arabidopsis thaliana]|uniref:(thale cress) hypothetical protein n=1 Tax=Arabidopsis thaliana TaxID=3702 RepID=A0A7G2DQ20_ARATH|nr:unnamed protein product [Arabidopsis thaliana]
MLVTKDQIHTICTKQDINSSYCFQVLNANPEIARLDFPSLFKFVLNYQAQNISDTLKQFKLSGGYTPGVESQYSLCIELYGWAFDNRDSTLRYLAAKDYNSVSTMIGGTLEDMFTCTDDLSTMKPVPQFFMTESNLIKELSKILAVILECFIKALKIDLDFWKSLFPVALAHTIGHVEAIVRCALAAVTELNFSMIGFMGAMISNLAFVFRNIFSKKEMKGKSVSVMNYYACLSMMTLLIVTPFANYVEGPQMWVDGWQNDVSKSDQTLSSKFILMLYNTKETKKIKEVDLKPCKISPLTFSAGNTMKRISFLVASIIIFQTLLNMSMPWVLPSRFLELSFILSMLRSEEVGGAVFT